MSEQAPLLELRGVSKSFGSVQALTDVDFVCRAGEVAALVGDNGAGKSTLIKCIAGIHPMDQGQMLFDGEPVSISGPKDAARLGIEVVYQDLALADNLDVVQNMFLGRETHDRFQRLKEAPMESKESDEQGRRSSASGLSAGSDPGSEDPVLDGGTCSTLGTARSGAPVFGDRRAV